MTLLFATAALADDATVIAKGQAAALSKLNDPDSAKFTDLRVVTADGRQIVCGRVNAKNRMGGYDGAKPFLFDPAIKQGAIIYGGRAVTDDPISSLAQIKGFQDVCG